MQVQGEAAKFYHAVRLDSFRDAHDGPLLAADEATGNVRWSAPTGEIKTVTLGQHAIKILKRR